MSAEDDDSLGREKFRMFVESTGGVVRSMRIWRCSTCHRPLAVTIPPDIEVVTESHWRALETLADSLGVPVPDPTSEELPACVFCSAGP
jgi:hypothetical protein